MTRSGKNDPQGLETTVTFLRMDTPLAHYPPRPSNINASLLAAKKPPLHFYRYLYYHVGIHWNWEARLRLSDSELAEAIHADNCEITVLYVDGAPAGYFEIERNAEKPVNLAYFGMMPHVHGMKLGRWFLGQAIASAWASKPQAITVNTCTLDHPAALSLYQKMGFSPVRQASGVVYPLTEIEKSRLVMGGIDKPA